MARAPANNSSNIHSPRFVFVFVFRDDGDVDNDVVIIVEVFFLLPVLKLPSSSSGYSNTSVGEEDVREMNEWGKGDESELHTHVISFRFHSPTV